MRDRVICSVLTIVDRSYDYSSKQLSRSRVRAWGYEPPLGAGYPVHGKRPACSCFWPTRGFFTSRAKPIVRVASKNRVRRLAGEGQAQGTGKRPPCLMRPCCNGVERLTGSTITDQGIQWRTMVPSCEKMRREGRLHTGLVRAMPRPSYWGRSIAQLRPSTEVE